jgi:hypothetical protein
MGEGAEVSFIDSTPIRVFNNQRIGRYRIIKGNTQMDRSAMSYFFGYKLYILSSFTILKSSIFTDS